MDEPDINDPGLLAPEQVSLLIDQYELAMAASYLERGMNEPAVFELFVRHLPPRRHWLLCAGLGPVLALVKRLRFGGKELAYLEQLGFRPALLDYFAAFRFSGNVDAMPEGTVAFAGEPLLRVTAPRIEAQLLETLLLNQINFQTAIATKAARLMLAAGWRTRGDRRRPPGLLPAARSRHRRGDEGGTVGRDHRRGGHVQRRRRDALRLEAMGTMAHSYVISFAAEEDAFRAFMEDTPRTRPRTR